MSEKIRLPFHVLPLDDNDRRLIQAAADTLDANYTPERHTVAAAVRTASGKIYTAVNIDTCAYGPCAEPIAIGTAFANRDTQILAIVAVRKHNAGHRTLPPCGNCRQLLIDYAPDALVILPLDNHNIKTPARDLLPLPYHNWPGKHHMQQPPGQRPETGADHK